VELLEPLVDVLLQARIEATRIAGERNALDQKPGSALIAGLLGGEEKWRRILHH
jgi:hypothetical protein